MSVIRYDPLRDPLERLISMAVTGTRAPLAMLMDVLNPQRIVLGGLAWRMGEPLLAPMRRVIEREALPQTFKACAIVPAALGEQIGDVSAMCVAMGLEGRG